MAMHLRYTARRLATGSRTWPVKTRLKKKRNNSRHDACGVGRFAVVDAYSELIERCPQERERDEALAKVAELEAKVKELEALMWWR